jgi:hypothetical protein
MTYDPLDTNETNTDADGALTIDDLTATKIAGLDTSNGSGTAQIFTDGEGGLFAPGYVSELPVAYQNLVAWYPFDSARYGGSNADDVTAIIGGSGDDTAFNGTVSGANYLSSGGVTDINAGANSGAFDFDGSNDEIDLGPIPSIQGVSEMTMMCWVSFDSFGGLRNIFGTYTFQGRVQLGSVNGDEGYARVRDGANVEVVGNTLSSSYQHLAMVYDSGDLTLFQNGISTASGTGGPSVTDSNSNDVYLGFGEANGSYSDCQIDDARVYDVALTSSQINQIYTNTEP